MKIVSCFLILMAFNFAHAVSDKMEKAMSKVEDRNFRQFVFDYNKNKEKNMLELKYEESGKAVVVSGTKTVADLEFLRDGDIKLNDYLLQTKTFRSDSERKAYIHRVLDFQKRNKKTTSLYQLFVMEIFAAVNQDELDQSKKLADSLNRMSVDWRKKADGIIYNSDSAMGVDRKDFVALGALLNDPNIVSAEINCNDDNSDQTSGGLDHANKIRESANSARGRTIIIDKLNDQRVEVRVQPVAAYGRVNYAASVRKFGFSSCGKYSTAAWREKCSNDAGEELYESSQARLPASVGLDMISKAQNQNEKLALALIACCEDVKNNKDKNCLQQAKETLDNKNYYRGSEGAPLGTVR